MRRTLFALAIVCAATAAGAQSADSILARAAAKYAAAGTMRVRFEQAISNPLTGNTSMSRGELSRRHPNLLSIDFTDPASDRIVMDGKTLWVYLPSSAPGQVMKFPRTAEDGMLLDPMGQILASPAKRYTVTGAGAKTINGHSTHAVTLKPKQEGGQAGSAFTTATVWIDDADSLIRQIDATEPSGLTRHIVITKFALNGSIPHSAFTFTPPTHVRIVDGTTLER